VLEGSEVVLGVGEPVVAEGQTGQVKPGCRGVDDAGNAGERQVAAQNLMRSTPGQRGEQRAGAGHALTVAD
jgi:hypothetical protein